MKKTFIYFLALLAISFNAQSLSAQKETQLGVKGGLAIPNLTTTTSNPLSNGWKSRLGPYFGAFVNFELSNRLSIQTELNYSAQGGKKNGVQAMPGSNFTAFFSPNPAPQYLYATYNSESMLNYLELPILVMADFPLSKTWTFFVDAGPYAGYLLSAKDVTKGSSNVYLDAGETQQITPQAVSFDGTKDIKSDLKKFNTGIQGGIGFSLKLKSGLLILSGGGNYGLVNIQKDKANGSNHTGAGTVTLGYSIKLK
ncbi:MAG TPA: porin family protein [Chitinophagaceae bacterium]|nr:porin family protein [Chitinophagaceae bacterium]